MDQIEGIEAISKGSKAENLPDLQSLKQNLEESQENAPPPEEVAAQAAAQDSAELSPEAQEQLK